jgi:ornithine decarboxylase
VDNATLACYSSIEEMVSILQPDQPIHCMFPEQLTQAATQFIKYFPGHTFYAIKANPDPYVLTHLHNAGINHFDVASIKEVQMIYEMFADAHMAFMNPVKSPEAIHAAYFQYGVRDFVTDTLEETVKIQKATNFANDLTIVVRLAMDKGSAACQLTNKFGCSDDEAVNLLQIISKFAKVGISFHVGSQTLDPQSYVTAIKKVGEVINKSKVKISVLDVGGGFPTPNLGMDISPMLEYFDVISRSIAKLKLPKKCQIWSEPGRALCGTCSTLVVRVELRKGDLLYINDGTYGNMLEVSSMNWKNSVKAIRDNVKDTELAPFKFYGPTCDSIDYMAGPFMLPNNICTGDWIAIESMGAYGSSTQTHFNGFYSDIKVEIKA